MDEINSALENDQLFAETNTIYDFYELEEEWEDARRRDDHPFMRYVHKMTDEEHIKKRSRKKD